MAMCETIVCILVDSYGDYSVGKDHAEAVERYENDYRPVSECEEGLRVVWATINVPCPAAVSLTGTAPDEGTATLTVR